MSQHSQHSQDSQDSQDSQEHDPGTTRRDAFAPASPAPATHPAAVGMGVTHARYVPASHAHYAGNLVDGAYSLALFGDVATELCIRTDGDEGLFASYSDVQFREAVRAGDCLEVTATLVRVGSRSREMDFVVRVIARSTPGAGAAVSAAEVLDPPLVATTARGTVVVPPRS